MLRLDNSNRGYSNSHSHEVQKKAVRPRVGLRRKGTRTNCHSRLRGNPKRKCTSQVGETL